MDTDDGWDGGWEEAVERGDGLEELMLGTPHPYDLAHSYEPTSRFASRHEIFSRPFADPADADARDAEVYEKRTGAGGVTGHTNTPSAPSRGTASKRASSTRRRQRDAPPRQVKNALRKNLDSRRSSAVRACTQLFGLSEQQVRTIVFTDLAVALQHSGAAPGVTKAVRQRYEQEMRTTAVPTSNPTKRQTAAPASRGQRPRSSPAGSRPAKRKKQHQAKTRAYPRRSSPPTREPNRSLRPPTIPVCPSCERPVRPDGHCGCS